MAESSGKQAEHCNPLGRRNHSPIGADCLIQTMTIALLPCLIFLLAGLVQGLTGFGAGLVALPLLCLFMDIRLAVPLCLLNNLTITTTMTIALRRHLDHRKILPLLLGSIPGVFVGAAALKLADPGLIKHLLAVLLISYSGFNLVFAPRPINPPTIWGFVAGFFTGAINAALSAGGPPAIIYATLTDWKKDEIKATLTGLFVTNGYITLATYLFAGMLDRETITTFSGTVFFVLAGTAIGTKIRIDRRAYLRLVYILLIGLGVLMLAG